jgi:hypothetical protein
VTLRRGGYVLLVIFLAACSTTPPVQEMSDARQAIAVAIDAGAKETASGDLRAAERYLQSAEKNLADRMYSKARDDARQAKKSALAALAQAEQNPPPE